MKAVVFHGIGHIKLDDVPEPQIKDEEDAIVRITNSAICGTDLHMVRGTLPGVKHGTILGHEAIGIVEEVGSGVKSFKQGDRVVVCSTIACGRCVYCKAQEYASCEKANPTAPDVATAFFGSPLMCGGFDGLQAEYARIPFADTTLVKLPDEISDNDGILLSDIFPTGYEGAEIADVRPGDFIAVFGCGPVGQMAIASAILLGAKQVFAVDNVPERLELASKQGAVPINYDELDPVRVLKQLTNGYGPDGCIDAVGIDAERPHHGPAQKTSVLNNVESFLEQKMVAPVTVPFGEHFRAGDGPSQALNWCLESVRKSGVIAVIGVYPQTAKFFNIGLAMNKSLTIRGANCSHRKYIPRLIEIIQQGKFAPSQILTQVASFTNAIECYKAFDQRLAGWTKVDLIMADQQTRAA